MIEDPVLRNDEPTIRVERNADIPVCIAQLDEAKLGSRVDDKVFRHLRHVNHHQAGPLQEFDHEIPVRHNVHRVLAKRSESELLLQEFSVDRVGVAGECGTAEGQGGDSGDELRETVEVGVEGVSVGKEEM